MPREDRRIMFDYTETYEAIFALCAKKGLKQPIAGSITAISYKADDAKNVIVRFATGTQTATSEYSRDFVAAALMLHCGTHKIPIPKKAAKSVELGAQAVTLHIIL
jgi:hypothetical protein